MVSAHRLSKAYGSKIVLDGIDLDVGQGEIYGLFGSNGCGKSTLLRILAGAIRPSSGDVSVRGPVGYVAQKFSLYQDLTVRENIEFFAGCHGMAKAEARSSADAVAERLGLASQMEERSGHLSHGWKQRLAVAAALVHGPRVLLLDEATAGIDPAARADFWEILAGYARSGATILFSSHYTDEMSRCDRIGSLSGGVLQ